MMSKTEDLQMDTVNPVQENAYININILDPERKKNKAKYQDAKKMQNRLVWIAVFFLIFLFFILIIFTSLFSVSYGRVKAGQSDMLENYEKMKTGQSAMFETSSHLETRIKKIESSLNIGTADPLCEMDWIHYGLNCYNLSLDAKTWNSAKKDCEEKGAHLVVIDGEDEMKFLDVFPHASEYLWIGLTKSGEWKWVDGSSLNKAFWAKGQPNNYKGKQNCGKLHAGLHDRDCPEASRYICEKPLS